MVKFETKVDSAGRVYLKEEIRKALGENVHIIPNAFAIVMFPANSNLENVKRSVELILKDIELRLKGESENAKPKG